MPTASPSYMQELPGTGLSCAVDNAIFDEDCTGLCRDAITSNVSLNFIILCYCTHHRLAAAVMSFNACIWLQCSLAAVLKRLALLLLFVGSLQRLNVLHRYLDVPSKIFLEMDDGTLIGSLEGSLQLFTPLWWFSHCWSLLSNWFSSSRLLA